MGTEVRFKDPKKTKSTSSLSVPGPGNYPLIPKWPGYYLSFYFYRKQILLIKKLLFINLFISLKKNILYN